MKRQDKFYAVLYLIISISCFMASTDERGAEQVVSIVFGVLMILAAVHTVWKGKHRR